MKVEVTLGKQGELVIKVTMELDPFEVPAEMRADLMRLVRFGAEKATKGSG
jgi:hypothetical protein